MTQDRTSAGARATVTIELSNLGSWGRDCTVSQIFKQSAESAVDRVRKAFETDVRGMRVIDVKVTCVFTEEG